MSQERVFMVRMLIVDDERWQREGLRAFLDWSGLGIEVVGLAGNGREGLSMTRTLQPRIVLTDILMPVMNGIDMSREIHRSFPDIRILLLSGYDDFQYAKEAFSFHAKEYLLKPVSKAELEKALIRVVSELREEDSRKAGVWDAQAWMGRLMAGGAQAEGGCVDVTRKDSHDRLMKDIRTYVAKHFAQPVRLGDVSRQIHLSPYYIGELFRKYEGMGFSQYLTAYRLEQARQFLVDTNHPVARVAERVGIPNPSYFGKLFKGRYGMSPEQYRMDVKGTMLGGQADYR